MTTEKHQEYLDTVCRLCKGPTTTALSHGTPYQVCLCCGSETLAADRWCRHKQLELPFEDSPD